MKSLNTYIKNNKSSLISLKDNKSSFISLSEKLIINKDYKNPKIKVSSLKELKSIVDERYEDTKTKKINEHIDLSDIDVSDLEDLSELFMLYKFKTIDISGWDTSNVKSMISMFYGCNKLEDIIGIEDIDIKGVVFMANMFGKCKKLDITDKIKDWKIDPSIVWVENMFRDCPTKFKFI